jgi:hypothetical protein
MTLAGRGAELDHEPLQEGLSIVVVDRQLAQAAQGLLVGRNVGRLGDVDTGGQGLDVDERIAVVAPVLEERVSGSTPSRTLGSMAILRRRSSCPSCTATGP